MAREVIDYTKTQVEKRVEREWNASRYETCSQAGIFQGPIAMINAPNLQCL